MRHVLGRYSKRPRSHWFQGGPAEPTAHPEGPTPFHDSNVFVYRMDVGKSDISRILMNPKHERLSGLGEIARHFLDPLPWLKCAQRGNAVLPGLILCLRGVAAEGQRQQNDD
jgi:hypothetical protein